MSKVSIVIRTFNEEKHLGNLLRAIQTQDYQDYEIIVVDSGSTDNTVAIAREFGVVVEKINSWDFTFGYSLNVGCKKATGEFLVFASAHVLPVDNRWLSNLIAPFNDTKVAMVYGRQVGHTTSKFSEKRDFKRIFGASASSSDVPLTYANNANAVIRRSLWEQHPFDEYLFGLEDIEWARWASKKGDAVQYAPAAAVYHIHNEQWYQVFNRYRREAIAAVRIGLDRPPQARLGFFWLLRDLVGDVLSSFPNLSRARLEEILRFRYYQWKGSRQGWFRDRHLDLDRDKYGLFFPTANQAVVIRGKNTAAFEEVPLPDMKPGDILIKVAYVGVCRTDLEVYEGTLGYYRDGLARYPIVPGHEFSGTIVKIGASDDFRKRFAVGMSVVGECVLSRDAADRKEVGVINYNGAYSQFVVLPGTFIHDVPAGMDLKVAALAEPLAVVLRGLRRLRPRLFAGASVAVVGAGPIGNWCAQVLCHEGYRVSVFDSNEERLKLLADVTHAGSSALTGLERFDAIVEATGSKQVLEQVLKESRTDSTTLLLGFPYGGMEYNFEDVVGRDKVIIGSVGAEEGDFDAALTLLPKLDTAPFTQTVLPLAEYKEAWEAQNGSKYFKVLLQP